MGRLLFVIIYVFIILFILFISIFFYLGTYLFTIHSFCVAFRHSASIPRSMTAIAGSFNLAHNDSYRWQLQFAGLFAAFAMANRCFLLALRR